MIYNVSTVEQREKLYSTPYLRGVSPTDLKLGRTSLKLWQTSGGEANGCHSAYPIKEQKISNDIRINP